MQPKPPTSNPRVTRSATQAISSIKSPTQQGGINTITIKPRKAEFTQAQLQKTVTTSIGLLQPIAGALNKALAGETTPSQLIEEIIAYINESESSSKGEKQKPEAQAEAAALYKAIRKDLVSMHESLSVKINGITGTTNVILETTEKTFKAAEDLKSGTNELIDKMGNVTTVTDKIANTTQSYRDVLVARQVPNHMTSVDPKVLGDMERRAKQILVDVFDTEGANTLGRSLVEQVDKANEVISKMTDADKPVKAKVMSANITKKGAVLLTLDSKETAIWLREPGNEIAFADSFAKGAHIRAREYSLVAPSIPLTFEPENTTHLREIEEVNNLPSRVIRKARWIKPISRRRPGQTHAFAILSVASVDTANKLIKDGVVICGGLIRPTKQKQEPAQCMKCRRWGHFAAYCPEASDTCGTCGGNHRTSNCESKEKLHCVSCGDNTHASWDRACPEFTRRCAVLDERNPNNSMPFFPTDEDWTLVSRPGRIPLADRFPAAYAVNSLPGSNPKAGQTFQRRATTHRATKNTRENPNHIPLPARNSGAPREAGEISEFNGGPSWMREPANYSQQVYRKEGEPIKDVTGWD